VLSSFDTKIRDHFFAIIILAVLFLFIYCYLGFYLCSENALRA